jgi:RNA polymerase sigma factor (sigma-70 family)
MAIMDSNDNQVDEEALWLGIQNGDLVSFEAVYNQYFKHLYNYGRKICSNSTIIEDAIHDVFLDVWKYHANLSATTSVRFYLYRALRRRIIKNQTKDLQSFLFSGDSEDLNIKKNYSQEEVMINSETEEARGNDLKKKLADLSPRQYKALILRFYDEFSYEEIGELLGVNEQSARNLIQRGLEYLRRLAKLLILAFVIELY